jgi:hypothetical protein
MNTNIKGWLRLLVAKRDSLDPTEVRDQREAHGMVFTAVLFLCCLAALQVFYIAPMDAQRRAIMGCMFDSGWEPHLQHDDRHVFETETDPGRALYIACVRELGGHNE